MTKNKNNFLAGSVVFGLLALALSLSPRVPTATAQATSDTANAFGLGVSMGFASFQATVQSLDGWAATDAALARARTFANLVKGPVPNLDAAALQALRAERIKENQHYQSINNPNHLVTRQSYYYSRIVPLRGLYAGTIRQASKPMGDAYDLGQTISIAEAQATAGEPARQIVRSSLVNARVPAANLGLPAKDLTDIIQQIDQGAPLNSIYGQITYLRGKYQSLTAKIVTAPAPAAKQATPKFGPSGPSKSPDQALLDAGCNRVPGKPGAYDCFTQIGFDICNSYKNQGQATACTTKLDQLTQKRMDDALFSQGCKRFLGRPDQYLCTTQRGFDSCETFRKAGKAKECKMAKM